MGYCPASAPKSSMRASGPSVRAYAEWAPRTALRARSGAPSETRQKRIEASSEAEASVLPSGENATHATQPLCPSSERMGVPVAVFHRRTVLSDNPEASVLPSGENATESTPL